MEVLEAKTPESVEEEQTEWKDASPDIDGAAPEYKQSLISHDLKGIAEFISSGKCKKIAVLTGAGISVSAGIPDYRSKNGLFETFDVNDEHYKLSPEQKSAIKQNHEYIANIKLFLDNPIPLLEYIRKLYIHKYKPTLTHWFIRLLSDKGLLSHLFTQNIDGLHEKTLIPSQNLIAVHGTIEEARCTACDTPHPNMNEFKRQMIGRDFPIYCTQVLCPFGTGYMRARNSLLPGYIKPNIVLYGEQLSTTLLRQLYAQKILANVDLLFIVGTSLNVYPISEIVHLVDSDCVRCVLNKDTLDLSSSGVHRDVHLLGECDNTAKQLIDLLGWSDDIQQLMKQ